MSIYRDLGFLLMDFKFFDLIIVVIMQGFYYWYRLEVKSYIGKVDI